MGYRIKQGEDLADAVRRIAAEQIDRAIDEIDDGRLDRNEAIHQVRKRCKKLRGLLRLVRPGVAFYKAENEVFRDAARMLSAARDLESMAETYDLLMEFYGDMLDRERFGKVRRTLTLRKRAIVDGEEMEERIRAFDTQMVDARRRVEKWKLHKLRPKHLAKGVQLTYGRAVEARKIACAEPSPEKFHEWRKRAKYHGYHVRLLETTWPAVAQPYRDEVKRVADELGVHHDLAVFAEKLRSDRDMFSDADDVTQLAELADTRRREIAKDVAGLGRLVFGFHPKHVGQAAARLYMAGRSASVDSG